MMRGWIPRQLASALVLVLAPACCPSSCCPPCEPRVPAGNPGDTYEVAVTEQAYDAGPWESNPDAGNIAGSVFFPAHTPGAVRGPVYVSSPEPRVAGSGRLPVVFLVHGRTVAPPTSYLGYWSLQFALAARGMVVVSVRMDVLDNDQLGNEAWTERLLANIDYFRGRNADPHDLFYQRLDFSRIGLMGHSRAADAVLGIPELLHSGSEVRAVLMLASSGGHRDSENWSRIAGIPLLTILPAAEGGGTYDTSTGGSYAGAPGYPHLPSAGAWEKRDAAPFKATLYVHRANHNSWNRNWDPKDGAPTAASVFSRKHHELILNAYAGAFFSVFLEQWTPSMAEAEERSLLRGSSGDIAYLNGSLKPSIHRPASPSTGSYEETRVDPADLHLSWLSRRMLVVDNFETPGLSANTLGGAVTSAGLTVSEARWINHDAGAGSRLSAAQTSCDPAVSPCTGWLRTELPERQRDVTTWRSVLVRAAEFHQQGDPLPTAPVAFELGLELPSGEIAWVHSDRAGGVPRPYLRGDNAQRFVLETLRFNLVCFPGAKEQGVVAIHLRPQTATGRRVVFDDVALE